MLLEQGGIKTKAFFAPLKTIKVNEITVNGDCRGSSGMNVFDLNLIQADVLNSSVILS